MLAYMQNSNNKINFFQGNLALSLSSWDRRRGSWLANVLFMAEQAFLEANKICVFYLFIFIFLISFVLFLFFRTAIYFEYFSIFVIILTMYLYFNVSKIVKKWLSINLFSFWEAGCVSCCTGSFPQFEPNLAELQS